MHYAQLTCCSPELSAPGREQGPGFRLAIVPANELEHPHMSLLADR